MGGFIRFVKKQHFWLVVPVLFIVMAAAWYMAASEQKKKFDARVSAIDSDFNTVRGVTGKQPHPNEAYHKGMEEKIKARAADVAAAWEAQYAKQVRVMKWSPALGPEFLAQVDKLRHIERVPEEFALEDWVLQNYKIFIVENELKRLAESIGSVWTADPAEVAAAGAAAGAYGGGYGGGEEGGDGGDGAGYNPAPGAGGGYGGYPSGAGGGDGGYGGAYFDEEGGGPVVQWSQESQAKILANSFPWLGQTQPDVRQMLYSQEDVWVLDSLMQIIKATNGDVNDNSQAIIKEIMSIDLAGACKPFDGEISTVQSIAAEEDDGMGYDDGMGGMGYEGGYGAGGYGGELDGEPMAIDPLEGRYVDANYSPMDAENMRSNATSEDLEQVEVAKRMPVRIRVKIDTRRFGKFLAACANAPLTFEVHQIRVNPTAGAAAGGMGMMAGGYGAATGGDAAGGGGYSSGYGAPGGGGGYAGAGSDGGYGGYGGGGLDEEGAPPETYDKTVEFFGLIHIYNPVDHTKLKTGKGADGAEEGDGEAEEEEATVAALTDENETRG